MNEPVSVRSMIVPDEGYLIADCDYSKADLHIVVWEADDDELKAQLREGVDVYSEAGNVVGISNYALCKRFIHGTDYGGNERTMAIQCGISVKQASEGQKRWFEAHPGIPEWHRRTHSMLESSPPRITNAFGYHRVYWGQFDDAMQREALAWQPQSCVALVTERAAVAVDALGWPEILIQGHDSLLMQFPIEHYANREAIREAMQVVVPYPDPLIIPPEIACSDVSWSHCKQDERGWHG